MDKGYYKKSQYVHLWVHLLLTANHEDTSFLWNNKDMILKRGQLLTGRKKLSIETGIGEGTIENILKTLENEQQILQQKTNLFRIITIINYDKMQNINSNSYNKVTTKLQQNDTYNNDKNDKKKILIERFEKFWTAFPKKVNKTYCQQKWLTVEPSEELTQQIIEAIEKQIEAGMLNTVEIKYCPDPSTWFNQRRWENEIIIFSKGESYGRKNPTSSNDKYHKRGGHAPVRDFDAVFGRSDEIATDEPPDNEHLE